MTSLIGSGVAFLSAVAIHGIIRRVVPAANSVKVFVVIALLSEVGLGFYVGETLGLFGIAWYSSILSFAFLAELYVFLFTMVISSVSVSHLVSGGRSIGASEQSEASLGATMLQKRVIALTAAGLIINQNGALALTATGRSLVRIAIAFRRYFGHCSQP